MKNKLYLECYSGISGDMTVAALLDLGADKEVLLQAIESLSLQGYEIKISHVIKSGIDACDFHVILDSLHENYDHDMNYLYGRGYNSEYKHTHQKEHMHEEGHMHQEKHSNKEQHSHEHRGMKEVKTIIEAGNLTEEAKALALRIFGILAEAEAMVHGKPVDQVHFHEVGAVDSIIDIVAVAVCMDNLGITEVIVPKLYEGTGTVRCQHGILPIPVPAVANIAATYGLKLQITEASGEFVTPTGAAIVAAVRTADKLPLDFEIKGIGIGAGKRNYESPGMLRAMLINEG